MKRITKEGLQEIGDRLTQLKSEREEVIERKQLARSYGDLKENSEYQEATSRLSDIDREMSHIRQYLSDYTVMENNIDHSKVSFGSFVTIKNLSNNMEKKYRIVDEVEADFINGKLAYNSPFAKTFLNKKKNDVFQYQNPIGVYKYQIIDIV